MLRASTVALVALAVLALNSSAQDGDFNMLTDPVTGSSLVLSAGSDFALVATGEYMVLYEYDGTPLNTIEFDGAIIAMVWVEADKKFYVTAQTGDGDVVITEVDVPTPATASKGEEVSVFPITPGDMAVTNEREVAIADRFGFDSGIVNFSQTPPVIGQFPVGMNRIASDGAGTFFGVTDGALIAGTIDVWTGPLTTDSEPITGGDDVAIRYDSPPVAGFSHGLLTTGYRYESDTLDVVTTYVPSNLAERITFSFGHDVRAEEGNRLSAWDVSTPGSEFEHSSWQFNATYDMSFTDVAAATTTSDGNVIAWASGVGFGAFNWSDPPPWTELFRTRTAGQHDVGVMLQNEHYAVTGDRTLAIWSFANLASPFLVTMRQMSVPFAAAAAGYTGPLGTQSQATTDGSANTEYVVLAAGFQGMVIVDVTDPANPVEVYQRSIGGAPDDLEILGEYAFFVSNGDMRVYQLSDLNAGRVGEYSAPGFAGSIAIHAASQHAYMTDAFAQKLLVVDISDPTAPSEVVQLQNQGSGMTHVDGDWLFVSNASGVDLYHLADPANPNKVGSLPVFSVTSFALDGDPIVPGPSRTAAGPAYLYMTTFSGLTVYNVTDPANPAARGTHPARDFMTDVDLHDGNAFVVDGRTGWSIIQFVPPITPVFISDFDATLRDREVDLTWQIAADEAFQGFKILRDNGDGRMREVQSALLPTSDRTFTDSDAPAGDLRYALVVVENDGSQLRSPIVSVKVPGQRTALHPASPNPFNPSTTIPFELAEAGHVWLDIFDARGRHITKLVNRPMTAGRHDVTWQGVDSAGESVGSGVYFARLRAGGKTMSQKLVLLK